MKDTFAFIANIITSLVFFGTIIFAIANIIWKKQCVKKYKISAEFFTYANKTRVLFRAAIIILLNITILSTIYLNYQDSLYNIKTRNIKEIDGFNHELIVYNKDNAFNYLYDSNKLLLKNNESPNIIYKVNFFDGNRIYLTDLNFLKKLDLNKFNTINNELELEREFKRLKFENNINKDEFLNTILRVPNNFKMSVIINYINQNNLLQELSVKSGYYVNCMFKSNSEAKTLDKLIKTYEEDDITLKSKEKTIKDFYHLIRINKDSLIVFKNTSLSWLTLICIILYIFVISIGIYLYYINMVKKNNKKIISKKLNHLYMLTLLASNAFSCCFMLFYNRNYYLYSKNDLIIILILIITLAFSIISFLCKNKVKKEHYIYIFCILLGIIVTFYTLWVLDMLIYILFNFYLLDIVVDVIIQTLLIMIGLIIIVISYANLFINSIILDLESKYKLIHINNKNNYFDTPEDLTVICEHDKKFLAVSYKIYDESSIILYTNEFWLINPCDCVIREKAFKNDIVIKENDRLISRDVKKIIRASTSYIENIQYSKEPIILYSKTETDKKSNIPQKDRYGLIINKDDYKIFKFKALLSDNNSELNNEVLKRYNMCLVKKDFKLEDIDNEMLGLDSEYVLWYLRYKNKFCIKKDTVNAYFVKNGMEIVINEDNKNEPLPIYFKFLIVINDNTVKRYLVEKYMDIKTVCELLNITEQDIVIIENYESNNVIAQIVDKEKDILNNNAIDKDTKTHSTENNQSQNKSQDDNIK